MVARPKNSEAALFERYRVALGNAETHSEVSGIMAELGFDSAKIAEGKALLAQTRSLYDLNKTEDDETSAAYQLFSKKRSELEKVFHMQRKKAKVIFRNDGLTARRLAISGERPREYINWLEAARKFYSTAIGDTDIQNKLTRLAITSEQLNDANKLLNEMETARAEYLRERGESQDATKAKDAALAKMGDWMSEFYAVARIGLDDKPQLLEVLDIVVKD